MRKRFGLRGKIALAFAALLVAGEALTALLAARVAARLVEEGVRDRFEAAAGVLRATDTRSSRRTLMWLRSIVGAGGELAQRTDEGPLSSFEGARARAVEAFLEAGAPGDRAEIAGGAYRVYRAPLARAEAGGEILLFLPESELAAAQREAAWPIALAAGAVLALGLAVAWLLAARITGRLARVAAAAGPIAGGDLTGRVEVEGTDEVADLARAFNQMVEGLAESRRRLVETERLAAVGQLAASVAHEVRNPLSGARLTVEMLQRKAAGDGRSAGGDAEALGVVRAELDRLDFVVDELLTFARPAPLARERADLALLAREGVALLARQAAHAHVRVEVDAPEAGLEAEVDPRRFKQVVVNLALNGIQSMPRGGTLSLRLAREAGRAVLSVADTGTGLSEDARAHVFDAFYPTKAGGAGLGLAITKRLVEEHGGTIDFETGARGTTFRVALPEGGGGDA